MAPFTSQVLDVIKTEFPTVEAVDVWSDGPSSQFKNKYIFALVSKLEKHHELKITWNYFATSHGKGPNDGLGGNVKRMAHRLIMTNTKMIKNAETFADAIQSCETGIHVLVMNEDVIEQRCQDLATDTLWDGLKTFQGTITTHCLQTVDERTVRLRYYTAAGEYRDVPVCYACTNTDDAPEQGADNQKVGSTVDDSTPVSPGRTEPEAGGRPSKASKGESRQKQKSRKQNSSGKVKQDEKSNCGCCNDAFPIW